MEDRQDSQVRNWYKKRQSLMEHLNDNDHQGKEIVGRLLLRSWLLKRKDRLSINRVDTNN